MSRIRQPQTIATQPVSSTTLRAAGYKEAANGHGKTGILRLVFRTGKIYDYFQVPVQVFSELMAATSKGRYFNFRIRDRYRFRRIR